jgi:uncharacterized protein (TIGR02147 family)
MNPNTADYRDQMKAELKRRASTNPRYSLRAFARDLKLSPSFLSKVLCGRRDLSAQCADRVANQMGYSPAQSLTFSQLVSMNKPTQPATVQGNHDLRRHNGSISFFSLDLDSFALISDWYHYAILFLIECTNFDPRPARIARRLGISTETAKLALRRLVSSQLIREEAGGYVRLRDWISTSSDCASQAVRNFHIQMIDKAKAAVNEQDISDRDISGMTLPMDPAKLALARREILKFRRRMARILHAKSPSLVYQLNIQFFRLSDFTGNGGKIGKKSRVRTVGSSGGRFL